MDLLPYLNPLLDFEETKYFIFGIIARDPKDNDKTACIVKKRIHSIQKYQWFFFENDDYHPISEKDALEKYVPKLIFYKKSTEKNLYFEYGENANISAVK